MPESVNDGNGTSQKPPKEMSMEVRLLLAFILMGVVMYVTQVFYKPTTPPPNQKTAQSQVAPSASPANQPAPAAAETAAADRSKASSAAAPSASTTPQQPQAPYIVDTDFFRIVFSNHGATVRSWQLKKYKDNDGKPLELLNKASKIDYPFSLYFPGQPANAKFNWTYYQQTGDPDGLGVTYDYSDGNTTIHKVFRFKKNSYLSQISTEVTVDGKPVPHMVQWRGGFGDFTVPNPSSTENVLYYDLTADSLTEQAAGKAKNGPVSSSGNYSFAGLEDKYFAAVFLPVGSTTMNQTTFADSIAMPPDQKPLPCMGAAVGTGTANHFDFFVGPKDVDLLTSINPKLEKVVSFGWVSILAKPLFLLVNWFNDHAIRNFGWSIVVITIAINFILFPLKLSNFKSMRKMQALKPQIDAINAKYKNLKMTDPKKGEQNQEVMDLYKKYGVNPMGGCFPMLIQIPFFFAFYKVFTVSVEMRGAPWLWVTDLSQPEHLAIKILPLVMIGSQFLMQKITPQANADPSQQKMMMFMPLIFGFMFYQFPSGLVLYYLTSNLVQMGQQWFFNHTQAAVEAAESVELPKKKNGRK